MMKRQYRSFSAKADQGTRFLVDSVPCRPCSSELLELMLNLQLQSISWPVLCKRDLRRNTPRPTKRRQLWSQRHCCLFQGDTKLEPLFQTSLAHGPEVLPRILKRGGKCTFGIRSQHHRMGRLRPLRFRLSFISSGRSRPWSA